MLLKKYSMRLTLTSTALALLVLPLGCGPDPGMYQGEPLTFETPVTSSSHRRNADDKKVVELDLGAEESSDFRITRIGAFPYVPWGPYPLYDYYLEPIPVEVPVSPVFSLVDYVHPFYAFAAFNPFRDDDDGLFFRHDDDDHH